MWTSVCCNSTSVVYQNEPDHIEHILEGNTTIRNFRGFFLWGPDACTRLSYRQGVGLVRTYVHACTHLLVAA